MSASQFIYYSSGDASGPGAVAGAASSLLTVLNACLVDGYSGHPAAGWTKPFADSGNIGCYQLGGGSGMGLVVNDNGANVTSTYREAWVTGWESIASIGSPVGTGTGQFPTPAQLLTTGHGVIRKSASADATPRAWQMWADAYTCHLFIQSGDAVGVYLPFHFGDIFSLRGATDAYRCLLISRTKENITLGPAGSANQCEFYDVVNMTTSPNTSVMDSASLGHFMPRNTGGSGSSITICKNFDTTKGRNVATYTGYVAMAGAVQTPNSADNSLYLSPLWISEISGLNIRGRVRGIYQVCHPLASFSDGQIFSGSNDLAGKSFIIVSSMPNGGFCAVETSATVETN